jgi:N6-L-threonylcarbamoyladenine synthase
VRDEGELSDRRRADLAASYQEAIVAPLAARLLDAAREHRVPAVALGGGVAANGRLRELVTEGAAKAGLRVALPEIALCTDNAAMIGAAAQFSEPVAWPDFLAMDAMPSAPPGGIAA